MGKLLFKDETYAIRGAVFEVYCEMGSGFLEAVYQECMEKELEKQGIPFESEKKVCEARSWRGLGGPLGFPVGMP